eukprot:PhM_4_TR10065/c0_g1_i3/m.103906
MSYPSLPPSLSTESNSVWQRVWHHLHGCTVLPSDTFITRMRKLVVLTYVAAAIMAMVSLSNVICGLCHGQMSPAKAVILIVLRCSFGAITISHWMYLRVKKEVSIPWIRASYVSGQLVYTMLVLDNPNAHFHMLGLYATATAHIARVLGNTMTVWNALLICLNTYNLSFGVTYDSMISISTTNRAIDTAMGLFITEFVVILSALFLVLMGLRQRDEYEAVLRRNELAISATRDIAHHLVSYDTGSARGVLESYEAHADHDAPLSTLLHKIVGNLDVYRAYLPNYLLQEVTMDDGDHDDHGGNDVSEDHPAPPGFNTSGGGSSTTTDAVALKHPRRSSEQPTLDAHTFTTVDVFGKHPSNLSDNPTLDSMDTVPSPLLAPNQTLDATLSIKTVTLGVVHAPLLTGTSEDTAKATNFVDHLHTAADATNAVVHNFYADCVMLSWNTARRTTHHEVRGAAFLMRCRSQTGRVGALATGTATFTLCGHRQVIPILQPHTRGGDDWATSLNVLLKSYAMPMSTNVCTDAALRGVATAFYCRAVGAFRVVTPATLMAAVPTQHLQYAHEIVCEMDTALRGTAGSSTSSIVGGIVASSFADSGGGMWAVLPGASDESADVDATPVRVTPPRSPRQHYQIEASCRHVTNATTLAAEGRYSEALAELVVLEVSAVAAADFATGDSVPNDECGEAGVGVDSIVRGLRESIHRSQSGDRPFVQVFDLV